MSEPRPPIRLMFVDDESRILRSLALQFRRDYEVITQNDPQLALETLRNERIDILVSDQRMPGMNGAELLARARTLQPASVRILLTGYSDLDAAVQALNDGEIFRYLTKPWNPQEMAQTIAQAAEQSRLQRAAPPANDASASDAPTRNVGILLLDSDPVIEARVLELCALGGHHLYRASRLDEAVALLNREHVDILISDLRLGERALSPLLKSLAQARPQALTIVTTPYQDTQALLTLINQARIFRYVLKPVSVKLFERALHAAVTQSRHWQLQPHIAVPRTPEAPRDEQERATVNGLVGMLGRLRERFASRL
ncbi:response regulator [Pseudothauera nasutitermitis]|uniref:Response regulator n=1 Tax=Pseudothauera nasutitermitis TaxID=2565930 RepID=A0A4S4AYW8_9RHOO|nr:response regulator [Pseudothauera nasutitermitis]THF63832.1 response regulator [Pseudothauera nasutitermitis]